MVRLSHSSILVGDNSIRALQVTLRSYFAAHACRKIFSSEVSSRTLGSSGVCHDAPFLLLPCGTSHFLRCRSRKFPGPSAIPRLRMRKLPGQDRLKIFRLWTCLLRSRDPVPARLKI